MDALRHMDMDRIFASIVLSRTLNKAAEIRAEEISRVPSHTRPDGTECYTALQEVAPSYDWNLVSRGENIAGGQSTVAEVMNDWMNSSGHRANILGASFTRVGLATYIDSNGHCHWVQLFTSDAPDNPYYGEDDGDNQGDGGYSRSDDVGSSGCNAGCYIPAFLLGVTIYIKRKL